MLNSLDRRKLREAMSNAFVDRAALELFVDDNLDERLGDIASPNEVLPMQCLLLIRWSEDNNRMRTLLTAFQQHPNPVLQALALQLLAVGGVAAAGGQEPRPHTVSDRPVIDRKNCWQGIVAMAQGAGTRVLAVSGGVGKSYTLWLVGHWCKVSGEQPARVEVDQGNATNVDAQRIAMLLSKRLWGTTDLRGLDQSLAQAPRVAKDIAELLVQRLAALPEPTWLVLDQLNHVCLDPSAIELISRLCEAVDRGECGTLRLLLLGLEPTKLGPHVGVFVKGDQVARPAPQDIADYLTWFAGDVGQPLTEAEAATAAQQLDTKLGADADHQNWSDFHTELRAVCGRIMDPQRP